VEGFQLDDLDPNSKKFKYIKSKIRNTNGGKDFDIKKVCMCGVKDLLRCVNGVVKIQIFEIFCCLNFLYVHHS
jgi:hypothetical protein